MITANGVPLENYALIVTDSSGLYSAPGRRGDLITVPGRHGGLRRVGKPYEAGSVVLQMTVGGCLPDGSVPAGSSEHKEMLARADELLRIFGADTVTLDNERPDGTVRRIVGEVTKTMDFTRVGTGTAARVAVAMVIPDVFWADVDPTTTGPFSLVSGGTRALVEFADATAPMSDLSITFGPGNNPELHQDATGAFIAYDGVIGSGQTLTIHCDDLLDEQLVGTGGLVPDYALLRYLPPRWFELDPRADLTVRLVHTGGGSMSVTVSGRRKYLTG